MKKKILCVFVAAVCLLGLISCSKEAYEDPLRLHVIANSNSGADQEIKYAVRDAVLEYTKDAANSFDTADDVKNYVKKNEAGLLEAASSVLEERGAGYSAKIDLGRFYFPDKSYGDVVYKAGYYDAVRIVLGEGKGENWWCVIFPPLCLINMENADENTEDVQFVSLFSALFS